MDDVAVRTIETDEELDAFFVGMRTAFLAGKPTTPEMLAWVRERYDLTRTWAAFDGGAQVGTTRTFPTALRLAGLAEVPASCLTQVTVLPTHTRRGHLGRLMRAQLEAAVDAGEAVSLLVAAEWPIYGRFGYGPSTMFCDWKLEVPLASFVADPVGRCEIVDAAAMAEAATTVLAAQQASVPGAIARPDWLTAWLAGSDPRPDDPPKEERVRVVHRDEHGDIDGYVVYDPSEHWDGHRPRGRVEVQDHGWTSRTAERELWRYLAGIDLVGEVTMEGPVDSAVRTSLRNGRAAHDTGTWDHIWAVVLDVEAVFSARGYLGRGAVVVEVADGFLGRGGTFTIEADGSGAGTCRRTPGATAEVTVPLSILGACLHGAHDLRVLAGSGLGVDEHRAGAVDRLASLLAWSQQPWCPTDF